MKNLSTDFLNQLPRWARDELIHAKGDVNDYFDHLVIAKVDHESTMCVFDNAGIFIPGSSDKRIVLTEHAGYHIFLLNDELSVHELGSRKEGI
jgi:hypothetical protein